MKALYDDDLEKFSVTLDTVQHVDQVQNVKGTNLFHDLANSSHPTLSYFLKCVNTLNSSLLEEILDSKSAEKDNLTPLQLAIAYNKRVKVI